MVSPNVLTADLEIWTDDHSLICKLRRFAIEVSGEDKDLKETYSELVDSFDEGKMGLFAQRIIGRFEREIYRLFIVDSDPSGNDRGWSMEDMKGEQFDWWEVCPHLVVTKVGEIDLSPIAHLDEDDEEMVARCCAMFGGLKPDELEDAIMNYRTESRYSVDSDLFKEVLSR